jgi:hypothetical protein
MEEGISPRHPRPFLAVRQEKRREFLGSNLKMCERGRTQRCEDAPRSLFGSSRQGHLSRLPRQRFRHRKLSPPSRPFARTPLVRVVCALRFLHSASPSRGENIFRSPRQCREDH